MPVARPLSRLVAWWFAAAVAITAVFVGPAMASAAPAPSGSVSLQIRQLPSSFTAGARPQAFESTVTAPGETEKDVVRHYVIKMTGLLAAHVVAERNAGGDRWVPLSAAGGANGTVTVRDEEGAATSKIRLAFATKTPAGRATLTLEGYDKRESRLLGKSSGYQTQVRAASASSSPSRTSGSAGATPSSGTSVPPVAQAPAVNPTESPATEAQPRADLPVTGTSGLLLGLGALAVFGGLAGVIVLALVSGREKKIPTEEPTA